MLAKVWLKLSLPEKGMTTLKPRMLFLPSYATTSVLRATPAAPTSFTSPSRAFAYLARRFA
jgi:hypothetical protein